MKRSHKLLLILVPLAAIAGTLAAWFLYYNVHIMETHSVPFNIKTTDEQTLGINADRSYLGFGKVPRGSSSEKRIRVQSKREAEVYLRFPEPFDAWMSVTPEPALVGPNKSVQLVVVANVPANAPIGNFSGNATLIYVRP